MCPVPFAVDRFLQDLWQARARGEQARVLDAHAPEALLRVEGRAIQRREVPADTVIAAWQASPPVALPAIRPVAYEETADGGAALYALAGTSHHAGFGVRGDQQLLWEGLVSDPAGGAGRWRLQALAEIAAPPGSPATSWLESAWARLTALEAPPILALPETRFTCQMSATCCRHEMTIAISEAERRFVEALDWQALDPGLGPGPYLEALPEAAARLLGASHRLKRRADGSCRFLRADRRCAVHALAGRAVFAPCHGFPFRFAESPEGLVVTTSPLCPSARAGLGARPTEWPAALQDKARVAERVKTDHYRLTPDREVGWEAFKQLEAEVLATLSEGEIERGLWRALCSLEGKPEEAPERLPAPEPGMGPIFEAFVASFDPAFERLADGGGERVSWPSGPWMRTWLFSKALSYPLGLIPAVNALVLAHALRRRHLGDSASVEAWSDFVGRLSTPRALFHRHLIDASQTPGTLLHRFGAHPRFGLNLLCWTAASSRGLVGDPGA